MQEYSAGEIAAQCYLGTVMLEDKGSTRQALQAQYVRTFGQAQADQFRALDTVR